MRWCSSSFMIPTTAPHGVAHTPLFAITAGLMRSGAAPWNFAASPTSPTTEGARGPGAASAEPQRDGAHLDARPRRGVRAAMRIVECHVRHAVCAQRIAVVGFEHQRLIPRHLRVPMPAVCHIVCDHQPLERPFRLAGGIEYG